MDYLTFRTQFHREGCFSIHQVYAWRSDFNKNNLTRWTKQKLLLKLRNGFYSFPDYLEKEEFQWVVANCIYRPSYISLHSALAFYGIIPEAVTQITSVTTLKTKTFNNDFGEFSYKTIRKNLFFGFVHKQVAGERTTLFASPEKALLDLLYLYPIYSTANELEDLRLDNYFMEKDFDKKLFKKYLHRFENKALEKRAASLIKIYTL